MARAENPTAGTRHIFRDTTAREKPRKCNRRFLRRYFENVSTVAWNFAIGGYQPAQKWLKDRKNRQLDFDDITHYQQMINALDATAELMGELDEF